jgi:ribonuclease HII
MPPRFDRSLIPDSPDLCYEAALWAGGCARVGGLDEAGRGALAGPVAVGVVILPPDLAIEHDLHGVRDSKEMTPHSREAWAGRIRTLVSAWAVGLAEADEIDRLGIVPAVRLAAKRALNGLAVCPQHLLVDYLDLPEICIPQTPLVKGDARVLSIAAASVLAKTHRDEIMRSLDTEYPGYRLGVHKGYGTAAHREAILRLGPSSIHRLSFLKHIISSGGNHE